MSPAETTVALVLVVAVVAGAIKLFSRDDKVAPPGDGVDPVDALLAEVSGADPGTAGELVAVTMDGWAFVPDGRAVAIVPHAGDAQMEAEARGHHGAAGRLDPGELIGVRIARGAADIDPWRLEALGRDGDYRAWAFMTEEAARAALDLLQRRVVRAPLDEDGDPRPPQPADFDAARRMDEETERALDEHAEPFGDEDDLR